MGRQLGAAGPQRVHGGLEHMGEVNQVVEGEGAAAALDGVDATEQGVEIVFGAVGSLLEPGDGLLGRREQLRAFLEVGRLEP